MKIFQSIFLIFIATLSSGYILLPNHAANKISGQSYPYYFCSNRDAIILTDDSLCHFYAYRSLRIVKPRGSARRAIRRGHIDVYPQEPHYDYKISGIFPYKISNDTLIIHFHIGSSDVFNYYGIKENKLTFLRAISYGPYANKKRKLKQKIKSPRWVNK